MSATTMTMFASILIQRPLNSSIGIKHPRVPYWKIYLNVMNLVKLPAISELINPLMGTKKFKMFVRFISLVAFKNMDVEYAHIVYIPTNCINDAITRPFWNLYLYLVLRMSKVIISSVGKLNLLHLKLPILK